MLIQLQPEQVTAFWPAIKQMAIRTGRITENETTQTRVTNILSSILSAELQCWIIYEGELESRVFHAIALTSIHFDTISEERTCVIDQLYAMRPLSPEIAQNAADGIVAYARQNECTAVVAHTNNARAISLLESHGFVKEKSIYILEV